MIPVIRGGQQRHSGLSPLSTAFQASVGIGMGARLENGGGIFSVVSDFGAIWELIRFSHLGTLVPRLR